MAGLSGGRDELMPKVLHYGGVQPPTPPSPMPPGGYQQYAAQSAHQQGSYSSNPESDGPRPDILARTSSMNGRRRGREEYERDNGSPPSSFHQQEAKRAFAAHESDRERDWRNGMSSAEKKEEFIRLCERAWDLFHS